LLRSAEWLAAHRRDRGVVVQVGSEPREFDAGHVPPARCIALRDIGCWTAGSRRGAHTELPVVTGARR
jgi:hypothetical protein